LRWGRKGRKESPTTRRRRATGSATSALEEEEGGRMGAHRWQTRHQPKSLEEGKLSSGKRKNDPR